MGTPSIQEIFEAQGKRRWAIAQTSAKERIAKLKKLREALVQRQREFYDAIWQDFHKSKFEAWECEIFPAIEEIDCAIKNLKKWMKDRPAKRVFFLPTTRSVSHFEPKGRVLIFAPWNYPLLLLVSPIVSAIAAGNVVMAKPSHKTPRVSAFLKSLFESIFESDEIAIVEGAGAEIGDALLGLPFDHVFFTGSPHVGEHVEERAAKVHAGVTLELGGKSPTVILPDLGNRLADAKRTAAQSGNAHKASRAIETAAKRIAWGKMLNAGQTCIAPDYVLCPRALVNEFAEACAAEIRRMYGESESDRRNSQDLVHIIDERALKRHAALIKDAVDKGAIPVIGMDRADLNLAEPHLNRAEPPTILVNVTADMEIMQSEIFGPILPIVAYDSLDDAISFIQNRPKPLSLYIFGKSRKNIKRVLAETTSGSTCVNNTIIQIENLSVPFGGVGMSGTGNYYGFKAFSHERNVMRQGFLDAVTLFRPPYNKKRLSQITQKALKFLKKF